MQRNISANMKSKKYKKKKKYTNLLENLQPHSLKQRWLYWLMQVHWQAKLLFQLLQGSCQVRSVVNKYFLAYCTSSTYSNVISYQFHIFPYHQSHFYTKGPLLTWLDHLPIELLSPWSLDTVSLGQITHFLATSYRGLLMVYYVEMLLESAAHTLDLWCHWTHTDVYATLLMRHPSYPKECI